MSIKRVFIDGQHGTVGLQIRERLADRKDLEIIEIDPELRKDRDEKSRILNSVDYVFLCLPDEPARESVSLIKNPDVTVFDGSTAHRTHEDWEYGIPELNADQRKRLKASKRISVPGCYATGFNLIMHPLVSKGVVPSDYPVSTYAITGYSGGGKQMIEDYRQNSRDESYAARPKNLNLRHKHLPEMRKFGLLKKPPIFTPIVGSFYQGMLVFVPFYKSLLARSMDQQTLTDFYSDYFRGEPFIRVFPVHQVVKIDADFVSPADNNGTNSLDIMVFDNDDHFLITARLDNLGKGASGAAVQNLNLVMGISEQTGLPAVPSVAPVTAE